jgi:predicted nucleotidyltransferase component of viral defense system
MTLDYSKHKNILLQILKDIYSDSSIAPYLGFKGGTAALMFYDLPRNSVDIDLDLLDESKETEVFEKVQKIVKEYGKITDSHIKRFNLTNVISYDPKAQNIKVEINRRQFGSRYDVKNLLGISMLVMNKEDMFAHKLMAMYERVGKTSRDIFDVQYFAKNNWPINRHIVEQRSKMSFKETLVKCIEMLEKMDNKYILDGLGELLTDPQKDSARVKLKSDTIFQLKVMLGNESEHFTIKSSSNLSFTDTPGHAFSGTDKLITSYQDVKDAKITDFKRQDENSIMVKISAEIIGHEANCYIRSKNDEGVKELEAILNSGVDFKTLTYDVFLNHSFKK